MHRKETQMKDTNVFICDDILIKALWLDEESRESKVFW